MWYIGASVFLSSLLEALKMLPTRTGGEPSVPLWERMKSISFWTWLLQVFVFAIVFNAIDWLVAELKKKDRAG